MHTSTVISSPDFQFWKIDSEDGSQVKFEAFCPNYHEQDRTAVVSPILEDGVLNTGYALLAMTAVFFDIQRSRSTDFFIYPQHFALLDMDDHGVVTHHGRLPLDQETTGGPWANLDVWPESKWYGAPGTASGMLQKVLDLQINRIFWPENLGPGEDENLLPDYGFKMLRSVLKSVYYYNADSPDIEVRANQAAQDVFGESVKRLDSLDTIDAPSPPITTQSTEIGRTNTFKNVCPDEFLSRMKPCFDNT
tara:strand:- start:303 stop:1049 length:747 start_codon:yes stop_codon:yes gene_type:complete